MSKILTDMEKCTGCMSCLNICPVNAIKLVEDKKGFLYTTIQEEKCIKCGACKKVCPKVNQIEKKQIKQALAVVHKDKDVLYRSSSGGMFTALSEYIIKNKRNSIWS